MNPIHILGDAPLPVREPLADLDDEGYIPTIDVIRVVRTNFDADYIKSLARRNGYGSFSTFDDAVAVEVTCRELLDSQRWLLEQL